MNSIRYELKYCEGCGTLKLRQVKSDMNYCAVCENMLARLRLPQSARSKACALGGPAKWSPTVLGVSRASAPQAGRPQ